MQHSLIIDEPGRATVATRDLPGRAPVTGQVVARCAQGRVARSGSGGRMNAPASGVPASRNGGRQ